MGGSKSSSSSTTQPSSVWSGQSPYLEALYGSAFGAAGGQIDPETGLPTSSTLTTPQNSAYNYASGITNQAGSAYGTQAGGGIMDQNLYNSLYGLSSGQVQNQGLEGAIQAGLTDITNNFNRNIMPGISGNASLTNTSGGSRQGIAEGLAASDANQQATDFVNQMYSQNFQQMLDSMLGANTQLGGLQSQANAAQQGAIGQSTQMAALGTTPEMSAWMQQMAPYMALSGIYGSPTVLSGGSQSDSKSMGGGVFYGG